MLPDKKIKKEFKKTASHNPDKYYSVNILKKEGFIRKRCSCGTFFWTTDEKRKTCGDPSCSGGFKFFEGSPARKKLDYISVWKEFSGMFRKLGYTPIERYPVAARWREDTDFVQASIYNFQPYVVSGEVDPPANPLVVPQFSLRFNDVDNVGITGAHYTGFVMIGQHAFMKPEDFNQEKYFSDIHAWLTKGLGLPNEEITYHEDAWAGGGNFGPCMEFFSRGLELGNQVYMLYEQNPKGNRELDLKVLDMGMGHERNAWFTQGKSTSYETTFPTVIRKLRKISGISTDENIVRKFLPYASYLNVDEIEDADKEWKKIADKIGTDTKALKEQIIPLSKMYSVGEHARTLLFALSDGALPSNTGGGYNLRVILRRALQFIDSQGWKTSLPEIAKWHAQYLKPIFPEVSENLDDVQEILEEEKNKYDQTKEKSRRIVERIIREDKEKIDEEKLLTLYDSQGISPEIISAEAKKQGKQIDVPEAFYSKVAERHEQKEQEHQTKKEKSIDIDGIKETEILYFDDYLNLEEKGKVIRIIDGCNVILDRTPAYPTSGGQIKDKATINKEEVEDIFKQGKVIIHKMKNTPSFKEGDEVIINIDKELRVQLAQHHTSTHIVNAAAKKVLGSHINQAGAKKTGKKATLDITHFRSITNDELKEIEKEANITINNDLPVNKMFLGRTEAEARFGMRIYQGGAVPGRILRIVEIPGVDVEACGGTHLNRTGEAGKIRLIKSQKISDSLVRITFTAGKAAEKQEESSENILEMITKILGCEKEQIPGRAEELFSKWKKAKKLSKKGKDIGKDMITLESDSSFKGDIIQKTCEILRTQPEHLANTLSRFMKDIKKFRKK